MTIVRLNKTCSPTLDHFQLVNVVVQVWVPDRAGIFKFRSPQRNVGKVAVSPDNSLGCDGQKLVIGMIWQHLI